MFKKLGFIVPYTFLIPALTVFVIFFFIPFFESFVLSFQSYNADIYNPQWIGMQNYIALMNSPVFWKTMLNTLIYVIIAVPLLVVLPLIIAIFMSQKIRGISIFRVITYIPVVVSIVVAGIAWKWLYASSGLINYFFELIHLPKVGWLTDPNVALYSVIAVTVWKGLGYYMVIYLSSLVSVPKDLYEAADIDGASEIKKHLTVSIPHLKPTIALVSIISTISAMKVFVEIYVMTQGGPVNSSKTIVYYIYQRAFENLDLGYASAAGVVLLLIIMVISVINMKYFENERITSL